ncbi:hypothetical protein KR018_009231, partial [Drosophila ironensis]
SPPVSLSLENVMKIVSAFQPDDHEYDGEADIRFTDSSIDLSMLQNVSTSTTKAGFEGKGRLDSLKENLHKQQERLIALKERARRKSHDGHQKPSTSDSMESLSQKLTVLKSRVGGPDSSTPAKAAQEAILKSGSEKLQMLTQRTEQNRVLLAQRKRDLAKSLLSVRTATLSTAGSESGSSMTDLRQAGVPNPTPVSRHRSALDLEVAQSQEQADEGRLKLLRNRMKITELKQSRQEQEMQEMRTELARRATLIEQLERSGESTAGGESSRVCNDISAFAGAEMQLLLTRRDDELQELRQVKTEAEQQQERLKEEEPEKEKPEAEAEAKAEVEQSLQDQEHIRLQGEVAALRERLGELENVNDMLETTRCELQDELSTLRESNLARDQTQEEAAPSTDAQVSQELAKQLNDLTNQLQDLQEANEKLRQSNKVELPVSDATVSERLASLEATIAEQLTQLEEKTAALDAQSEELAEKTTELNVLNVNLRVLEEKLAQSSRSKPLFLDDTGEDSAAGQQLQEELQQLKQKLDESNKANIKLKLKCKQAEKQLEKLQTEDGQKQLSALQAENERLQQWITVLEDEKGQWQLSKMQDDEEAGQQAPSPEVNPLQLEAIRLLEEQKLELQQALEALQQGHESARNMELLDKLEKLSSSSSAESIEIVERQQLLEDPPTVTRHVSELTQTDEAEEESGESLAQLRERLQLFTQERGEVLDKLEQLTAENNQLQAKLDEVQSEREKELHSSTSTTSTASNLSQELTSMQRSTEVVAALDAGEGGPVLFEKCEKSLGKLSSELEAYRKAGDRNAKFNVSKKLAREAKHCHAQMSELLAKVKEASSAVETVTVVETVVAVTAPNGKALAEYEQLTAQNAEMKAEIARLRMEIEDLGDASSLAIAAPPERDEEEVLQLQSLLEDSRNALAELRQQSEEQLELVRELRQTETDHLQLVARQSAEITQLQLQGEQLEQLLNTKEMGHEKQLEQQTRVRRELEARGEALEGQLSILQALVAEQKQQLIENLSESEHALNLKMLELQSAHEEIQELRTKSGGDDADELREALRISKSLAAQQVSDLAARQDTIDALNQQVKELFQGVEQVRQEEQAKTRDLKEKLKKYAVSLKKRGQENADLEEQLKELRKQLQEKPEPPPEEQLEPLRQQVAKLSDELKAKIHQNLENRDAVKQLKQQLQEQELANKELRRERQEADEETFQQAQENAQLKADISRLGKDLAESRGQVSLLQQKLEEQLPALEDLRRQLESKSTKFDKSKELIKHRNATIQALQKELQHLRQQPVDQEKDSEVRIFCSIISIVSTGCQSAKCLKRREQNESLRAAEEEQDHLRTQLRASQEQYTLLAEEYARDKADFEMTINRLETLHEGIQAKLQEDASYIETLESQASELQSRSAALEDEVAHQAHLQAQAEDRRQVLEQELQQQRQQDNQLLEQEQELQQRLRQLAEQEATRGQELQAANSLVEEYREQLTRLRAEHEALATRHDQVTARALAEREQLSSHSQEELADLRQHLEAREADWQRQRQVYDAKLAAKTTELDEMECELNGHVQRATQETRDLLQQLERSQEQVQQRGEELQRLGEEVQEVERARSGLSREVTLLRLQQDSAEQDALELQELRMQAIQDKTEMDNLRTQIDALCANHSQELQALQQQIAEMDTLGQNQTDDQVFVETENKRLAEQLQELQAQLARQPPPVATSASSSAPAPAPAPAPASLFFGGDPSPFDEIVPQPLRMSNQAAALPAADLPPTIEDLQRNVSDLEKHAQDLENKLLSRNQTLAEQEERRQQMEQRLTEMERLLAEREQQLAAIQREREEQERLAQLEKLIQPAVVEPAPASAPTLDMFFGAAGESIPDAVSRQLDFGLPQAEPVEEPLIQPKKAYLCHPSEQVIDFGVDEDPWASAATEEPQTDVEPLRNKIAQLEQKLEAAEQQKNVLHSKAAKLMKRLKDYKSSSAAQASPPVQNDLDSAIIDELRVQLQMQEARQARVEEQLQQHLLEKEKLTKRIDVLTAGNERMAELKERQDMDVQMYQARIRELQEKLNQLDQWDAPPEVVPAPVSAAAPPLSEDAAAKLQSLQTENQDLNSECQELQEKLKEERRLVQAAEDAAARAQAQTEQLREDLQVRLQEVEELRAQAAETASEPVNPQEQQKLQQLEQLEQEVAQLRGLQAEVEQLRSLREQQEQELASQRQQVQGLQSLQTDLQELPARNQQILELQAQLQQLNQAQAEVLPELEQLRAERSQVNPLEMQVLRQQLAELEKSRHEEQAELEALRQRIVGGEAPRAEIEDQTALLQEKESEIVHLKQRIEELMREDQTEKLVFEILTKNQELHMLRMQVKRLEEDTEVAPPPAPAPAPATPSPEALAELEQLRREKSDMEEELRVLNNHVLSSLEQEDKMKQTLLQLDTKNIEITELRRSLEVLQAQTPAQAPSAQPDLATINQQWEQVVEQKCGEVAAIWQEHLNQREAAFQAQLAAVQEQQKQPPALPSLELEPPLQGSSTAAYESSDLISKMQKALETQEIEIVTLKEQLAIRSAEYARLAAQYDPFRLQNRSGPGSSNVLPATAGGPPSLSGTDPSSDYVLKADLDYALMMLHQRDMRVEEMIVELVQLLEERDHLQLKLSDTLRQLETERSRSSDDPACNTASSSAASGSSPSKTSSAGSSSEILGGIASNTAGSDLKQKLAELQTVKHSKDKAIVDEREQRLQQMLQLQKDMAKAAATATATSNPTASSAPASAPGPVPAQSHPTAQQTALRSPSMMLMDWIMGKGDEESSNPPAGGHQSVP